MPDWVLHIGGMLFAGGMYYGAIRADLKALHEKIETANRAASRAHQRIDNILGNHHG